MVNNLVLPVLGGRQFLHSPVPITRSMHMDEGSISLANSSTAWVGSSYVSGSTYVLIPENGTGKRRKTLDTYYVTTTSCEQRRCPKVRSITWDWKRQDWIWKKAHVLEYYISPNLSSPFELFIMQSGKFIFELNLRLRQETLFIRANLGDVFVLLILWNVSAVVQVVRRTITGWKMQRGMQKKNKNYNKAARLQPQQRMESVQQVAAHVPPGIKNVICRLYSGVRSNWKDLRASNLQISV